MYSFTKRTIHSITVATPAILALLIMPLSQAASLQMDDSDFQQSAQSLFSPNMEGASKSETLNPDTVVAKVDGEEILFKDLQARLQAVLSSVPPNVPPAAIEQQIPRILSDSLNGMIVERLIKQEIEAEGISVSEKDVDEHIAEIEKQIPAEQELEELLAAQNVEMDDFRAQLKEELAVRKLIDKHVSVTEDISEEQIEKFYEENKEQFSKPETVKASHILIGFEEDDDADDKQAKLKKIKEIRAKIVADELEFADAAKDNSTCPSSQQGGSLGEFGRGQMVPAFEEVAFSQEIGELSETVETDFGYHLIMVEERSDAETVPLEEVSENIKNHLIQRERQQSAETYISSLREDADVEVLVDVSKIGMAQPTQNTAE